MEFKVESPNVEGYIKLSTYNIQPFSKRNMEFKNRDFFNLFTEWVLMK